MKNRQINIRLNEIEYLELKLNADILGIKSPTTYARKKILSDHIIKPKMPFDDIKYVRNQIKRCGNNINQIAYLCNRNGALYVHQIRAINDIRKELELICQRLK